MPALTPDENALAAEAYLRSAGEIVDSAAAGYRDPRLSFLFANAMVHAILATRPSTPWTSYASSFDSREEPDGEEVEPTADH